MKVTTMCMTIREEPARDGQTDMTVEVSRDGQTWGRILTYASEAERCVWLGRMADAFKDLLIKEPWEDHPACFCEMCRGKHNHRFSFDPPVPPIWEKPEESAPYA